MTVRFHGCAKRLSRFRRAELYAPFRQTPRHATPRRLCMSIDRMRNPHPDRATGISKSARHEHVAGLDKPI